MFDNLARTVKNVNALRVLVGKREGKKQLGGAGLRWECKIKKKELKMYTEFWTGLNWLII
jgi:hypothetical protein